MFFRSRQQVLFDLLFGNAPVPKAISIEKNDPLIIPEAEASKTYQYRIIYQPIIAPPPEGGKYKLIFRKDSFVQ